MTTARKHSRWASKSTPTGSTNTESTTGYAMAANMKSTDGIEKVAGTMPDKAAAKLLGRTSESVRMWRNRNGVPAFRQAAAYRYTREEKRNAVDLAYRLGNCTAAGNQLEIAASTVLRWVKESGRGPLDRGGDEYFVSIVATYPRPKGMAEYIEERRRE